MSTANYSATMTNESRLSLWAKLRRRRTKAEMIATVLLAVGVLLIDGLMGWIYAGTVALCWVVWALVRPMPANVEAPTKTPAENRAATLARWAEGAERERASRQ